MPRSPSAPGAPLVDLPQRPVPLSCLVVDDSVRFLQAARALLEREGVAVVGTATTAAEGFRLARALRPDVVLVDIMLGQDDGFELASRLVADDPGHRSSVVLVSTHSEADFAELIEESPADGFLAKAELSASALYRFFGPGPG